MDNRTKNIAAMQNASNAVRALEAVLADRPASSATRRALAQTLVIAGICSNRLGEAAQAVEYFDRADEVDPA